MTVSTERPEVLIDTAIANKSDEVQHAYAAIGRMMDRVHSAAGDRRDTWTKGQPWKLTDEEAIVATPRILREVGRHADAVSMLPVLRQAHQALVAQLKELGQQYTGWQRFFLVTSSDGGHIHATTTCGTCRWTTQFGWLPQLSGLTEADAVEAHGPRLCSVCFPSAPLEWTLGIKRDYCVGSDQPATVSGRSHYVRCPACAKTVAVTKYGQIRKHQPAKAAQGVN